jgi:multisubunit Na+/H+ antiporter MnhF subunit
MKVSDRLDVAVVPQLKYQPRALVLNKEAIDEGLDESQARPRLVPEEEDFVELAEVVAALLVVEVAVGVVLLEVVVGRTLVAKVVGLAVVDCELVVLDTTLLAAYATFPTLLRMTPVAEWDALGVD